MRDFPLFFSVYIYFRVAFFFLICASLADIREEVGGVKAGETASQSTTTQCVFNSFCPFVSIHDIQPPSASFWILSIYMCIYNRPFFLISPLPFLICIPCVSQSVWVAVLL